MKKINTKPFELVDMTYEDYQGWCKAHNKKERDIKSKKEFFEKIRHYDIYKKDGILIEKEN